jgi:hypothetical protein
MAGIKEGNALGEPDPKGKDGGVDDDLEYVVMGDLKVFIHVHQQGAKSHASQDVRNMYDGKASDAKHEFPFPAGGHGQDESDVEYEQLKSVAAIRDAHHPFVVEHDLTDR